MFKKLRYIKYYTKVLLDNWTVNKNSYAQHGEDNLIELLLPSGVSSFIDIGANDGVLFSNTYKFAKMGASGLCVEPSKSSFRKLRLNHLFHPAIQCLHSAISDRNGLLFLKEEGYECTLSNISKKEAKGCVKIQAITFDSLLSKFPSFQEIDLLSVDVEGHEDEVFSSLKNDEFSAKIIILESDKSKKSDLLSIPSLKCYEPICTNGLNTILFHKMKDLTIPTELPQGFQFIK